MDEEVSVSLFVFTQVGNGAEVLALVRLTYESGVSSYPPIHSSEVSSKYLRLRYCFINIYTTDSQLELLSVVWYIIVHFGIVVFYLQDPIYRTDTRIIQRHICRDNTFEDDNLEITQHFSILSSEEVILKIQTSYMVNNLLQKRLTRCCERYVNILISLQYFLRISPGILNKLQIFQGLLQNSSIDFPGIPFGILPGIPSGIFH